MALPSSTPFGLTREQATDQLATFLHETLREPEADLVDVRVAEGRWESRVANSQRGISVVFLAEHNARVVPGHMTLDAHAETIKKR
jgi:hypothetical protein